VSDLTPPQQDGRRVTGCAVVVATDVRLYSEGLALVFAADGRLHVSQVADTAERAALCIAGAGGDALLIDATMQGVRGVLQVMRERVPRIPVVIFGVPELDEDLLDCIEAGAVAFVSRDVSSRELIETVLSAQRGDAALSPGSISKVLGRLASRARLGALRAAGPPLTARERELGSLLDEGLSNKEIALRLHISVATVKNHVHRILEKLQVERRGQAASLLRQPVDPRI
jgi:DNA-binding NarL/FixJ family response regulator